MEKSFDFGRILKKHVKQKPVQFLSVSGGVKKRLEANIQSRKSNRLTTFDNLRRLSQCESPTPVPDSKSKSEHRRQQLEKWKEEKEKQKKEAAAKKKKPFVVGVAHAPLKFVPPPPPKAMPSTSGRVTRSQATKTVKGKVNKDTKPSFAPKNATFRPPNLACKELPTLVPVTKKVKKNNIKYDFEPLLPNTHKQITRQTRSKTTNVTFLNNKTQNTVLNKDKPKGKITKKASPKPKKLLKPDSKNLQSSSSSELDSLKSQGSSSIEDMGSSSLPILDNFSKSLTSTSSSDLEHTLVKRSPRKKTPRKSLPNATKLVTPKSNVPKSESNSEEKLRSPKTASDAMMTPEQIDEEVKNISPCVTMSRGKENARKEMKKKIDEGLLDDDASNLESVEHFRCQLNSEIRRITERCDLWDKIQEDTLLPESVQELVLGAVGQGRLLVAQKLRQFGSLVETCAKPVPGTALVTPADLQGFWDMVFMQVENIDMRFKKLEELRLRNWVEEKPVEVKKRTAKVAVKKPVKTAGGPSRLKDMIAAARKAKKEQELAPASPGTAVAADTESKTFDAGFFSVKSPVRSPAVATPTRKPNLLKAVLSSEAKKSASKNSTSFAMLRASVLSKNMDHDGIAILPQTPVNLSATPGRSILKSVNNTAKKKSGKKSIKVVLFDDAEENDDVTGDTEENKENVSRKPRLVRQEAVTEDSCGVMTRSRRKSMGTPQPFESIQDNRTPRRSAKKKA